MEERRKESVRNYYKEGCNSDDKEYIDEVKFAKCGEKYRTIQGYDCNGNFIES